MWYRMIYHLAQCFPSTSGSQWQSLSVKHLCLTFCPQPLGWSVSHPTAPKAPGMLMRQPGLLSFPSAARGWLYHLFALSSPNPSCSLSPLPTDIAQWHYQDMVLSLVSPSCPSSAPEHSLGSPNLSAAGVLSPKIWIDLKGHICCCLA